MLNLRQRALLLKIAREAIEAALEERVPAIGPPDDEALLRPSGAFVTLTIGGDLRGCIGSIDAVAPLWSAVATSARNAAFRDPRFPALRAAELPAVEIEISVMGPLELVSSIDSISVGRDGLIVSGKGRAGLLLPQVATEYGWDRETFLSHTCQKAGLPADAWRQPGCTIEKFSAEVLSEAELTDG